MLALETTNERDDNEDFDVNQKERTLDMNLLDVFDTLLKKVRYASRTLGKSPACTAVPEMTLALGLGTNRSRFKGWTVCGIALVSFVAGSLITARLEHASQVRADSNRVFELRVYHTAPGKVPALESRFRDIVVKLFAKHDLTGVGYWVPEDAPASDNTFIYLLAHPSREEAKKNWDAMHADPAFQQIAKSEQTNKLVEKVDSTFMHPADFSPLK